MKAFFHLLGAGRIAALICCGVLAVAALDVYKRHCNLLRKAVSKKDPADYEVWEKALMAAGEDKCDWTDKKYIEPIIAYLGK